MKLSSSQQSPLRLIKWCAQWQDKENWEKVPVRLRGIYVLHNGHPTDDVYDVVYVGMAASGTGIKRRLRSHARSKSKGTKWTHFSMFVVWENVREEEIRELESLLQEIYRKDRNANRLAKQKGSKRLRKVRHQDSEEWQKP